MADELSSERIREIYADFAAGRLDRLATAIAENVDFISHAPVEYFPYLGRRRGWAELSRSLTQMHEDLEFVQVWPISVLVSDQRAAITVLMDVRRRSNDRRASFLAAHFLRFHEGKVVEFCGIIDSLDAVRQLGPPSEASL